MTISHKQRDALYELVVDDLTAIGDVWGEFNNRDFATAKRQAREFVQDLHLLNDLGWDETVDSEQVTLTVPPGELVYGGDHAHVSGTRRQRLRRRERPLPVRGCDGRVSHRAGCDVQAVQEAPGTPMRGVRPNGTHRPREASDLSAALRAVEG